MWKFCKTFAALRRLAPVIAVLVVILTPLPARALEVQEFTTPGGITVWLVEEHSLPIVSMQFAFRGGAANDPVDRQGLAGMLALMLLEGAGDMESLAYHTAVENELASIGFSAARDDLYGTLVGLTENRDRAFGLLSLALLSPRFDAAALERTRTSQMQSLQYDLQDPYTVAVSNWMAQAFGDDPYGRRLAGTFEGLAAITPDDLRSFAERLLARDALEIVVVGDVDRETLAGLVDETFGGLPEASGLDALLPAAVTPGPVRTILEVDIPQAYILFGHAGIAADHPDYFPVMIMAHVLGGGMLTSRLNEEVRIKRGLAYGITFYLSTMRRAGLFYGETSTQNPRAGETMQIIDQEVARMAQGGPTEAELEDAKLYLTGSYALRFGTGANIATALLGLKLEGLGPDFVNRRNALVEAVTIDDVRRVARELLRPGELLVTVVGRPEGIQPTDGPAAATRQPSAAEGAVARETGFDHDRLGCLRAHELSAARPSAIARLGTWSADLVERETAPATLDTQAVPESASGSSDPCPVDLSPKD
jgi:zinc protease